MSIASFLVNYFKRSPFSDLVAVHPLPGCTLKVLVPLLIVITSGANSYLFYTSRSNLQGRRLMTFINCRKMLYKTIAVFRSHRDSGSIVLLQLGAFQANSTCIMHRGACGGSVRRCIGEASNK